MPQPTRDLQIVFGRTVMGGYDRCRTTLDRPAINFARMYDGGIQRARRNEVDVQSGVAGCEVLTVEVLPVGPRSRARGELGKEKPPTESERRMSPAEVTEMVDAGVNAELVAAHVDDLAGQDRTDMPFGLCLVTPPKCDGFKLEAIFSEDGVLLDPISRSAVVKKQKHLILHAEPESGTEHPGCARDLLSKLLDRGDIPNMKCPACVQHT